MHNTHKPQGVAHHVRRVANKQKLKYTKFMSRFSISWAFVCLTTLAGCADGWTGGLFGPRPPEQEFILVPTGPTTTRPIARPVTDGTGEISVASDPSNARMLGLTIASLGDATTPGLWLETPLVTDQGTGWVIGENGMSVPLTLRPSGGERGSGSRMSMAVYQELGLSLTALPTITVLSDG